jgi:hypothetical protein
VINETFQLGIVNVGNGRVDDVSRFHVALQRRRFAKDSLGTGRMPSMSGS